MALIYRSVVVAHSILQFGFGFPDNHGEDSPRTSVGLPQAVAVEINTQVFYYFTGCGDEYSILLLFQSSLHFNYRPLSPIFFPRKVGGLLPSVFFLY